MRVFAILPLLVSISSCSTSRAPATKNETVRSTPRERAVRRALRHLRAREAELRREALAGKASRSAPSGPDPLRLCAIGGRLVGLLRGSSELTLLDTSLNELERTNAPAEPMACAAFGHDELAVIGSSPELWVYRLQGERLERVRRTTLRGALSPRALVASERHLYVADQAADTIFAVEQSDLERQRASPTCRRPSALALTGSLLVVNCLFEHALSVRPLDRNGLPATESARIESAGPFWGIAALAADDALWIAASGVEDRPLERFDGAFGYVDSFVSLFRVRGARRERVWSANVSEQSILVPKALRLERAGKERFDLWVSSSGTDRLARFEIAAHDGTSRMESVRFVPGVTDLIRLRGALYGASSLLDVWATSAGARGAEPSFKAVESSLPAVSAERRLGEALAFTSLMAPHASSAGHNSRFTCETCHFEGGVDARVHHTGRGNVHVVTRPLFGLLRNAPHFSRALDPDLTSVSHNEFRVTNLGNPDDPWFTLRAAEFPWLSVLGVQGDVGPEALRRALLQFLAGYEFPPNPRARGRQHYSREEAHGAELFRDRCESCHAARLASDDPASHFGFDAWEVSLFELGGPLTWARGDYELTGVVPYVNEKGTRVPSLRRISEKFPYFTNGSARSLGEVVARSGQRGGYFSHAASSGALEGDEARALVAFLELL